MSSKDIPEFTVSGTTLQETSTAECLHCHSSSGSIQVACDECNAHICSNCHWCHEFQANHEIRVCDRCDGFYCKACDEMDQCDDCAEVVCGSCSALLSCKFCGGGLCPECATACGKCGIVLCSRDAKFAVECDSCKLSYCLVCLASSSKDPCVRCGHRPSKRMEQLVHLRLKSIYKAFQQAPDKRKSDKATAAAAAAACSGGASSSSSDKAFAAGAAAAAAAAAAGTTNNTEKEEAPSSKPEKPLSERQAQADAAAAALLAELDEEEEKKKKKRKKKKKKEIEPSTVKTDPQEQDEDTKTPDEMKQDVSVEEEEGDLLLPAPPPQEEVDPAEAWLCELVADGNMDGVEAFLAELKGVPGKAALRKNAKKALKRLREEAAAAAAAASDSAAAAAVAAAAATAAAPQETPTNYKPPEPLLTLVSRNVQSNSKSECVLHMAPSVVGWVIGKGGQRIRDLMEESGSKVWIDQDSMGPQDPRVVYVSGPGKSVDDAVRRIKELVAKAPVGGTTGMTVISSHATKRPSATSSTDVKKQEGIKSSPARPVRKTSLDPAQKKAPPQDKDWAVEELECEMRFVPLLIGRRGWTIKHIQDSSGARVDIDQTVTPRCVRISGKKQSVASAVRMVQDVLSYPHAHLDQNGQDIMTFEEGNHSPPPSSLIMTNDNKSTISVSSSLSSTPEPSMASSGKGSYKHPGQLSAGAMIPPPLAPSYVQASSFGEYAAPTREAPRTMGSGVSDAAQLFPLSGMGPTNSEVQQPQAVRATGGGPPYNHAPPPPQVYGQSHLDASFGHAQQSGMPYGRGQQQQLQPGSAHGQSQQQQFGSPYANAPPLHGQSQQQQQPPYGNMQSLGGGGGERSLLHESFLGSGQPGGSMRQDSIGRSPGMSSSLQNQPTYPTDSYQPAHLLFQSTQEQQHNDAEAFLPDLWGRSEGPAGLFHRQHSDQPMHPHLYSGDPAAFNRRNSAPNLHHGPPGLDSDMVDSLFAPSGEQNLLSGFQGLAIHNTSSNDANKAGWSGAWGNDAREGNSSIVAQQQQQQSNLLPPGGLLDSSQQQNQPAQSRFDWG